MSGISSIVRDIKECQGISRNVVSVSEKAATEEKLYSISEPSNVSLLRLANTDSTTINTKTYVMDNKRTILTRSISNTLNLKSHNNSN